MSRAARKPRTRDELDAMTLKQLNAALKYLEVRKQLAGTSVLAKQFGKEIAAVRKARERNFGIRSRR